MSALTESPLALFNPLIVSWFEERFERPTPIQAVAWPHIAAGEHVLLTAPTGSGKTLTAFLWAINQLVTGTWPTGELSVLYISPLKALNNDIRVNLREPLQEIRAAMDQHGKEVPEISVLTRSGDTPQSERQRMVRRPPEILITTPESLNLILSSRRARHMLATVRTVILDEIHAVVDSKRGTHLITGIERVAGLAGEVQRIAVSATVRPLDLVAQFVGGFRRAGDGYERRPVVTLESPGQKKLDLSVEFPSSGETEPDGHDPDTVWPELISRLRTIIARNRSTLIFVTTRRHAEKITGFLNEGEPEPIAYAHHGSLSRELRSFVETSLKAGRLRAIVATNSLELGIDIGELDEIVMVQSPFSVSSALQRLGRAGHQVDETSVGTLFPLFGRDALDAAVVSHAALAQDIEPAHPVAAPLDVLAQQVVSMTAVEVWDIDDLFGELRCSWPYHSLERRTFDLVIEMLAGRYEQTRIRELKPRVILDRLDNTIRARDGALPILYQSGGTIPDRGYYGLRLAGEGAKIGELDEEFVWERHVGDTFYLGSQLWTIRSIGDRDVEVVPGAPGAHIVPFWKAEARGRGSHIAGATLDFLEACERAIETENLDEFLRSYPELAPSTRTVIATTLASQRASTRTPLPHRHHVVIENYIRPTEGRSGRRHGRSVTATDEHAGPDAQEIVIHCPWGTGVNQPLSMTLAALWGSEYHCPLEVFADDNCLVILAPPDVPADRLIAPDVCRSLLRSGRVEDLLRKTLEHSGLFGAMFRENAGRALLLPKGGFDRRMPLWLNRLRSKKLLGAVEHYEDFPVLLETWRACLQDQFDLPSLRQMLGEIASGAITISSCETLSPSPFAAEVVWRQTNLYMYLDDSRPGGSGSALSEDLLRQAAANAALRPDIPRSLVSELESRLQRTENGYAPTPGDELVDWIRERLALPAAEAVALRDAMVRDAGARAAGGEPLGIHVPRGRLCWLARDGGGQLLVAVDQLAVVGALLPDVKPASIREADPQVWWEPDRSGRYSQDFTDMVARVLGAAPQASAGGTGPDPASVLSQWLRFYGPRDSEWIKTTLSLETSLFRQTLDDLSDRAAVLIGRFTSGVLAEEVCDRENVEHLLALLRRSHRPVFEPVEPTALVALWARLTGLTLNDESIDPAGLVQVVDALFGFAAPAAAWESDILPARLPHYYPIWMDGLFKESDLTWFGAGRERIGFTLREDMGLFAEEIGASEGPQDEGPAEEYRELTQRVAESLEREKTLFDLCEELGETSESVTEVLWAGVWSGQLSNDSFETVRQGILSGFQAPPVAERGTARHSARGRRAITRAAWMRSRPTSGRWFTLHPGGRAEEDPIMSLEDDKDKARILLARYGVLFRDLLTRELPTLRWSRIFRALRMMELSGEVVGGAFIRGIDGVQFATPHALSLLSHPYGEIVWMNASDPASPCGLPVGKKMGQLPSRLQGNHIVFRGPELVLVSRKNGADLTLLVASEDPDFGAILAPLKNMVARQWNPRSRVTVETINGQPALESEFAGRLEREGFRRDYRRLVLSAGYR